jgi:hypothetical protein
MRTIALLVLAVLAPVTLPAQQRVERRHAVDPAAAIRLTVLSPKATIHVVGWEHDSLVVTGTAPAGSRVDGGVGVDGRAAKYFVESGGGDGAASRLELRVPARARVWVKASTADVRVEGVAGGLDLNIIAGSIRVAGAPRELNAEAMDGDIEVGVAVPWLRAKTAGGAITLRGGDDVAATSVSGPITVGGARLTRARLESVTGDITVDADVERDGSLTVDSHSGAVAVRASPEMPASYDVTSIAGEITNGLTAARAIFAGERRSRELGFDTAGGGAQITVRTFKGAVTLRRR